MFEDFKWYKHLGQHQTAWAGHILYIYNQIPIWKPKTIVELGVYLGHSLLTVQKVVEIKNMLKSKEPQVRIAKKYGVTPGTIWKIKFKKIWNY